jgi:small nuclear ribonucleoprotein (snRNP)-like protein
MPSSYTKINYSLRPAKAIERKMICDSLFALMPFGKLKDYKYIGFGSTYFVDFSLFHKVLHIQDMVSIEKDSHAEKRFEYNKPFSCIKMKYGLSNEILLQLTWDKKVIAWLDYDDPLNNNVLDDVKNVISNIISGSVFIISVSCQEDYPPDRNEHDYSLEQINNFKKNKISERISPENIPTNLKDRDLSGKNLGQLYGRIIKNKIEEIISILNSTLTPNKQFFYKQIFNFRYSDGAKMMTIGWLFYTEEDRCIANQCSFDQPFNHEQDEPYFIQVPSLTLKEQQFLDAYMPIILKEEQEKQELYQKIQQEICISKKDVESYAKIYKYFPSFVEMVI